MKKTFIPRDKAFWLFHLTGWGALVTMNMVLRFYAGDAILINFIVSLLCALFCTLASLTFRHFYYRYSWFEKSTGSIIPFAIGWSLLSGILVGVLLAIYTIIATPLLGDEVSRQQIHALTLDEFFLSAMMGYAVPIAFVQSIWTFIYVMMVTYRRAQSAVMDNLRLENTLKDAKLNTLAGQLNPHFLFNSLNNLRFMVHQDAKRAEDMITSLSDILRYSLDVSKRDKVVVQEEIDIVQHYIELVKIQLGHRLKYQSDIDPEVSQCLIPPMVVQMLVENAVKHGIDRCPKGGELTVVGEVDDNSIGFVVSNDVPEIEPKKPTFGPGIGLKNIRYRLELLYNENASLNMLRQNNKVIVTLKLPREKS